MSAIWRLQLEISWMKVWGHKFFKITSSYTHQFLRCTKITKTFVSEVEPVIMQKILLFKQNAFLWKRLASKIYENNGLILIFVKNAIRLSYISCNVSAFNIMHAPASLCIMKHFYVLSFLHCKDLFGGKKCVQEVGSYTSKKKI